MSKYCCSPLHCTILFAFPYQLSFISMMRSTQFKKNIVNYLQCTKYQFICKSVNYLQVTLLHIQTHFSHIAFYFTGHLFYCLCCMMWIYILGSIISTAFTTLSINRNFIIIITIIIPEQAVPLKKKPELHVVQPVAPEHESQSLIHATHTHTSKIIYTGKISISTTIYP